jgi:hypothetical protein
MSVDASPEPPTEPSLSSASSTSNGESDDDDTDWEERAAEWEKEAAEWEDKAAHNETLYGNAMAVTSRALEKMDAALEVLWGTQSEKKVLADRNDTLTEYVIMLENAASGNVEASAEAVRVANSLRDALASARTLLAAANSEIEDHTDTSMALRNALLEATGYKNAIQVHESFLQSISSHVVNYTEAFKKHTQRQRWLPLLTVWCHKPFFSFVTGD